ncbi:MAG TPA: arsenate reductase (glutaredoxin) [Salinimicrobium sp.]|nr:arsenate reductase (glutaredoxin) [Salinimicrobium sp.]
MIKIYHNTRCSKSREGLEIVENSGQEFEVREYLKQPLSEDELKNLLQKLQMKPSEIVRRNENIWKEQFKNQNLNDEELIKILVDNPQLIERPIVEKDHKAVVGRPSSEIEKLIN